MVPGVVRLFCFPKSVLVFFSKSTKVTLRQIGTQAMMVDKEEAEELVGLLASGWIKD